MPIARHTRLHLSLATELGLAEQIGLLFDYSIDEYAFNAVLPIPIFKENAL
jgi:hypothetical protein